MKKEGEIDHVADQLSIMFKHEKFNSHECNDIRSGCLKPTHG